jgi:hypothetical protein
VKRKLLYVLMFGATAGLIGCGGGGGGGGGGTAGTAVTVAPSYLNAKVPYGTPTQIGQFQPLVAPDAGSRYSQYGMFNANISNAGGDDLILAGRESAIDANLHTNSRIEMFGWVNGNLVDVTNQWFKNNSNIILGTEPSIKFADWFHTGHNGMFVSSNTDIAGLTGPGYVYVNNGNSFSRIDLAFNGYGHGSDVYDLTNSGYKDIIMLDANKTNTTIAFNNQKDGFRTYTATAPGTALIGGSDVAVGDFLNNHTTTLIVTDAYNPGNGKNQNHLYSWSINNQDQLGFTDLGALPTPRFQLPKWASLGITTSHDVRVIANDFDNSGVTSAIIFSQPGVGTANYGELSEIQFIKNNGAGVFSDVTDSVLIGYNTNSRTTYTPKLLDINGDGLMDILVSGDSNTGTGSQILLHTRDQKYVAAYQNILTTFNRQTYNTAGQDSQYSSVDVVKDPSGRLYLVSYDTYLVNGVRQIGIYLSSLGAQSTTTAVSAVNMIKQAWPYMTDAQANTVLAKTAATWYSDVPVIDDASIMQSIGTLSIPTLRGRQPIHGLITGLQLESTETIAVDSTGRYFNINLQSMVTTGNNQFNSNTEFIDQYDLTSHAEYLINGMVTTTPTPLGFSLRGGAEGRTPYNTSSGKEDQGYSFITKPTQYTIGVPDYYKNGSWSMGMQYSNLNYNPWIGLAGAWGEVVNSTVFDNLLSYHHDGFVAKASVMYVTTTINPGLITNISPMIGGWSEMGYRYNTDQQFGDLGLYVGVKPVVFSGSVEAKLPTGIDNAGTINYTSQTLGVRNDVTGYARLLYTRAITKYAQYKLSGTAMTNGEFRFMNEFRLFLD